MSWKLKYHSEARKMGSNFRFSKHLLLKVKIIKQRKHGFTNSKLLKYSFYILLDYGGIELPSYYIINTSTV